MSFQLLFAAALCLLLAGCAAPRNRTSTEPSHRAATTNTSQTQFGIFLTANSELDTRLSKVDLAHIQLAPSPLISADDIISYDFSHHSMKVHREALARIPSPPLHGLPFVIVANGQRIYLGAFWTEISSITPEVPTIDVNKFSRDHSEVADVQIFPRVYPPDPLRKSPDPRDDSRIKNALAALHKLK